VVLVTPNDLHRSQSEAALAGGLDVFVEKPIANTSADGLAMIQAAERADRLLMVGHNMRYARSTQKARERLSDGSLGQIVSVEIHFSADNTGRMSADAWRLRPDRCPLLPAMQLGIHGVDLVHYLLGPITTVHALTRSMTTQPGVIDSVAAVFELEGGATGTLVTNYCTQALFEYRITGTEGTLRCTPHSFWFRSAEATDPRGEGSAESFDYSEHDRESYRLQMEAFGRAVRSRQRPDIDGWDGLRALAVVEALQDSAAERMPQTVATFTGRRGGVSEEAETRLHG
jgi:predicted dehydrogenase